MKTVVGRILLGAAGIAILTMCLLLIIDMLDLFIADRILNTFREVMKVTFQIIIYFGLAVCSIFGLALIIEALVPGWIDRKFF